MSGNQPLVLDATVISNFVSSGSLTWLREQSIDIEVPVAVREEIERGIGGGHEFLKPAIPFYGSESIGIVAVEGVESQSTDADRLDRGETAALTRAETTGGTLVTDDGTARRVAHERSVPVTGSVGLLVLGVERDTLSIETADQWLQRWREKRGYYAPVTSIRDVLSEE